MARAASLCRGRPFPRPVGETDVITIAADADLDAELPKLAAKLARG